MYENKFLNLVVLGVGIGGLGCFMEAGGVAGMVSLNFDGFAMIVPE